MKPATITTDRIIWRLWKGSVRFSKPPMLPKDIVVSLNLQSVCVVYNALYREKRRRGIPLKHWLGPKRTKKDKKVVTRATGVKL
jgi:hypothetical protein